MRAVLFLRVILAVALCCAGATGAAADGSRLALLPLDAPGKLAIYGQPVAAEIARALVAGGLEVVVVGAQMAVPREAELVIEGSILAVRKRVKVELRLRTRDSREPLATASSSEMALESVDRAAGEVAQKMLTLAQAELAQRKAARPSEPPVLAPRSPVDPPGEASSGSSALAPAYVAVTTRALAPELRPVLLERMAAAAAQLTAGRWSARVVELPEVSPSSVVAMIAATPGALGIGVDVREVQVSSPGPLVGTARARVVVAWGGKVVLDRELATDTVVGGRKGARSVAAAAASASAPSFSAAPGTMEQLLDLLAREVVSILRPRYLRAVAAVAPASPGGAPPGVARAAR